MIEHMFEYGGMQTASAFVDAVEPDDGPVRQQRGPATRGRGAADHGRGSVDHVGAARAALERITALRSTISDMESIRVDVGALPTSAALAPLLPGGAIRAGSVYSVQDSMLLVMAMLQAASASGAWCAVVGVPSFGIESAAAAGIDLERLALVPDPGDQWLGVTAALADVATIVVTRPLGRVTPGNAARLAARLRQRGAALVSLGAWPGAETTLRVTERTWQGIGAGFGFIGACQAVVSATGRAGAVRPVTATLMLPAADGSIGAADAAAASAPAGVPGSLRAVPTDTSAPQHAPAAHSEGMDAVAVAS